MRTKEEIKEKLDFMKQQYQNMLNEGNITRTKQIAFREHTKILYWVLNESEE